MLRSLVPLLRCPVCLTQKSHLDLHGFQDGEAGHVTDGALACQACCSWYPIENGVLELVKPALLYENDLAAFINRYRAKLDALGISNAVSVAPTDISAQQVQRQHFDWYAGNEGQTYNAYQRSPFWTAFDATTFSSWNARMRPGLILDVGCADGRSCFPFVNRGHTIIGFDISKALVQQAARRANAHNAQASTTFFVSDASALPFRDDAFDYVVVYGVLHHVPDPEATCREVYRVLKPEGVYFGSENNVSIFRGIFDLLMRIRPIWSEEAGKQPLISRRHIDKWLQGLPASLSYRTSVFLPPQLLNLAGHRHAPWTLALSDKMCAALPGLRNQGGLIVFELKKDHLGSSPVRH
jgi:SAM-dependent methyltransferase/uncharacterized protein YbaR (Trm112 family)